MIPKNLASPLLKIQSIGDEHIFFNNMLIEPESDSEDDENNIDSSYSSNSSGFQD